MDLIRGIIIHIRNGRNLKDSQSTLVSMLEKLLSKTNVEEKKHILEDEKGIPEGQKRSGLTQLKG